MSKPATIDEYQAAQDDSDRATMERLRRLIDGGLAGTESKLWHGHPVWFIDGNPIVGYQTGKGGVRLMFWSGQSFANPGLEASGSFKAAARRYADADSVDEAELNAWLAEAPKVQWDYKNIVKRKGKLERLC